MIFRLCNIVQPSVNECNIGHITRYHCINNHLRYIMLCYIAQLGLVYAISV
jgi:hypothetical protein